MMIHDDDDVSGWGTDDRAGSPAETMTLVILLICVALMFLSACPVQAQTLTNADLGKPLTAKQTPAEAITILQSHQYQTPVVCRCDGPTVTILSTKTPTLGPWDFPEPTPARRLDGTRVDDPPTVYGIPPYWSVFVSYPTEIRRHHR
jgi:hypothetical protein